MSADREIAIILTASSVAAVCARNPSKRSGMRFAPDAGMKPDDLRHRFRLFARDVVFFTSGLFDRPVTAEVARQLMRAARGAASMHRAAGRARSHREFTSTIAEALEEADEAQFWLQHLADCSLVPEARLQPLLKEATELTAILTASYNTARGNDQALPPPRRRKRQSPDGHVEGAG